MNTITLLRPDDWHLHLRDGAMLEATVPETARHFARALVMPNLVAPVFTTLDAIRYRDRILAARPAASAFAPLMTLYLTETTDPDDVEAGFASGAALAVKLYPAGATTNSQSGVKNFERVMPVLERMAKIGMTLCIHGEVTNPEVDIFDREAVFIDTVLDPLRTRLPELRITLEHVTTTQGVDYIRQSKENLAATITTHHLILNRNALLAGGLRPHYYCLPVAKREKHRLALRKAVVSGDRRFFLGTDSAPHIDRLKESACGCAGCFTATNTMSCLASVFEQEGALEKLEGFTSNHGSAWYGLPANDDRITLVRRDQPVHYPSKIDTGLGAVTIFDPMFELFWEVV